MAVGIIIILLTTRILVQDRDAIDSVSMFITSIVGGFFDVIGESISIDVYRSIDGYHYRREKIYKIVICNEIKLLSFKAFSGDFISLQIRPRKIPFGYKFARGEF
jgi:hypothetical protein